MKYLRDRAPVLGRPQGFAYARVARAARRCLRIHEKKGQKKYATDGLDDASALPPPSGTNGGYNRRPTEQESPDAIPF